MAIALLRIDLNLHISRRYTSKSVDPPPQNRRSEYPGWYPMYPGCQILYPGCIRVVTGLYPGCTRILSVLSCMEHL